jgi:hypothetical protein
MDLTLRLHIGTIPYKFVVAAPSARKRSRDGVRDRDEQPREGRHERKCHASLRHRTTIEAR